MLNIDQTQSFDMQTPQRNEFVDEAFQYEKCPHCQRSFFMGKLRYHLKLCKSDRPMFKTPLKSTRQSLQRRNIDQKEKDYNKTNDQTFGTFGNHQLKKAYQICQNCKTKLPGFMIYKHLQKCKTRQKQYDEKEDFHQQFQSKNGNISSMSTTNNAFNSIFSARKTPQKVGLPTINIRKAAKTSEKKQKMMDFASTNNTVRIRDDLRCFRIASQVQKVTCPFCDRRFSSQASQRHIPICKNLTQNEQKSIALRRKQREITFYKKRPNMHDRSKVFSLLQPPKEAQIMDSSRLSKNQFLQIKLE